MKQGGSSKKFQMKIVLEELGVMSRSPFQGFCGVLWRLENREVGREFRRFGRLKWEVFGGEIAEDEEWEGPR